ncbi:hypothetical protein [Novosphingobium sp. JCM 18896]|uniref:hypothetical protein n=1 Tax=Novosphingobium sp. JCM 18896 TaxID=2989731 RepID=UPI00222361E2|nr:hypothetical protein [Novosphingobium sp. JCM 18896]MCW1428914.1 hypothetical protein [Novosphingobium sp. JCM 18896]
MKRLAACLALLALAPAALAQDGPPGPPRGGGVRLGSLANPSAAIAAEIAFARLAQEKGQWTAFKATAAEDAVMFTPRMVLAQAWLKDRANPPAGLNWQPHEVWSSCDGSLMVTHGAWQNGARHGWFTTVWQRQDKGGYKWVLDHGDETKDALEAPDMLSARVAECPERRMGARPGGPPPGKRGKPPKQPKAPPVPFDPAHREGRSNDGSLIWSVDVAADGARSFVARMASDGEVREVRNERVTGS